LGHLAIKFGVALGADVTAVSSRESKVDEAKKLGAHHFLASSNKDQFKAAAGTFDFIVCAANGHDMDYNSYFTLLRTNGVFIMVGAVEKMTVNIIPFLMRQIAFTGSIIGSPATINEMLKFASENNILADIETFPMENVNDALQGVRDGKPRFRYVLQISQ
jgi:D-arabinose 1-dehydrogenase-like Zn-dependent alcohol dehydrogenase